MTEYAPARMWECDRCDTQSDLPPDEQPRGWMRVHLVTPPRASITETRATQVDLCAVCAARALNRVTGADEPAAVST